MILLTLFVMPGLFLALAILSRCSGRSHDAAVFVILTATSWLVILSLACWGWLRRTRVLRKERASHSDN